MTGQFETGVFEAAWRYRVMVATITLLAVSLSFTAGTALEPATSATATIGLRTPRSNNVIAPGTQGDATLGRYTAQRSRFVTSDEVLTSVAHSIGEDDAADLRSRIHVQPSLTSNTLSIRAEGATADDAVDLALAIIAAYSSQTKQQVDLTTIAAVDAIEAQIATLGDVEGSSATRIQLQLQIADLESSRAEFDDGVEFVVAPTAESVELPGFPIKEIAIGLLLGLAIGMTAAWLRAERDRRVVRPEHAEVLLDRPMLAWLGEGGGMLAKRMGDRRALPTHDHRLLWTALSHQVESGVVVASAVGPAHSGSVILNLAAAAARESFRVLVVDANIRSGSLSALLSFSQNDEGLTNLLLNEFEGPQQVIAVRMQTGHEFSLLPSGPISDEVDVSLAKLEAYVGKWRTEYDYVLIDADRLGVGQLASRLASVADAVLPVIAKGVKESEVETAAHFAAVQGATVVGFAFADETRTADRAVRTAFATRVDDGRGAATKAGQSR
jgi:Mrp family chromosome partitioning ATPase/capsular polysaccharide biosynthesis protein